MLAHARAYASVALALTLSACAGGPAPQSPSPRGSGDDDTKTIAELTESSRRIDGLFTLFQDTITGKTHMLVRPEQVGREYVYFAHTVDGVVDAGHFRGNFRSNRVISVQKHFDRVLFQIEPTWLYFDPSNALARAADANVSPAVLASAEIVARDSATGDVLIEATPLFTSETFAQVKPAPNPDGSPRDFSLGSLSSERTRVVGLRSYPENTDVVVDYVYEKDAPLNGGGMGVTDARAVTIRMQHSFIEMPQNDYQPRFDDPRVGYFLDRGNDMLSTSATPYRDLINRWNLVKRDPSAAISEPVEPIVWWIENTTPVEFRPTIRAAVLEWNKAFEQAGFRNAVEVREQPDDAEWDAGDIRYNVLRWTSSPEPPFGGYGPSFTNPRTGQILGADIMLEYVFVTNRLRQDRVFDAAALDMMGVFEEGTQFEDEHACALGLHLHQNALFGLQALRATGATEVEVGEYIRQSLHYLLLHEVGHTLGLNHNMKASQARALADLSNSTLTAREGLYGSVMDYPDVNLALPGQPQGEYFMTTVGPYDKWAIEFGYSPAFSESAEAEEARLEAILSRSTDPTLVFGNDADDMRSAGKAIDPRVNINDLSSDAITYAVHKIELAERLQGELLENYREPGQTWHEMLVAYFILTGQQASASAVLSRYIGGVYVDRAVQGQAGATQPFTPVARTDQKRAMAALARDVFAPDAFATSPELLAHLAMQRRDFDFFSGTEDPKVHDRVLNIQRGVLAHLLHATTLRRVTDSRLYGNEYPVVEIMSDLTAAIFDADMRSSVNTMRQALQIEYVSRLGSMIAADSRTSHDQISRSAALAQLRRIDAMLASRPAGNAETQAHTQHLRLIIDRALAVE